MSAEPASQSNRTPVGETSPRCRYAVLLHTGSPDGAHYDFLIEPEPGRGDLLTFRLTRWPLYEPAEVTRLRDHRRIYLTYQGRISGDRGTVDRVDEGLAQLRVHPRTVCVALDKSGGIRFDQIEDERWQATPVSTIL